jgi:serine/threonine protein phosphatase PrpC
MSNAVLLISALCIPYFEEMAHLVNICDSRIYRLSKHLFQKLVEDDNILEMPYNLTCWVLLDYLPFGDFKSHGIKGESNYLLCSDGFCTMMEEERPTHLKIYISKNLGDIDKEVCALVRHNNSDDASCVLIKNSISGE